MQNSAMTSSWKIAISGVCIVAVTLASVVWCVHRGKAIEWKKLFEAANQTRAAAEQGDAKAQAKLGSMYSQGKGVPQDYAEALRWYRKAADQGNANGQDGLAFMYSDGQGVPQDYAEALRWYRKAADQGNANGQDGLAFMYSHGQGVPQDYAEALRWYRKSANQGYAKAQYNLGTMYYHGQGVPQDRAEAERWYHRAADQGDEYAQRALGLRGRGLGILGAVTLSAMLLWCLRTLKDALLPQPDLREPQRPALTIAGISGLFYIGLSVYGAFGSFPSLLTVNAFHFGKSLAAGITIAVAITVFGPKKAKVVLAISSTLLIVNDLIVIWHHQFMRFATTIRSFSSVNGLLIGIATPLAIFLWLETITRKQIETEAP